MPWQSAITKASITAEKLEPGRDHGTSHWDVLLHWLQATRGTRAST